MTYHFSLCWGCLISCRANPYEVCRAAILAATSGGRYRNLPYAGVCSKKNMHFVSEANKHAKLNFVEPDLLIRRVVRSAVQLWQVWKPALLIILDSVIAKHALFACQSIRSLDAACVLKHPS